jgi:phosphohistidine phosphatase
MKNLYVIRHAKTERIQLNQRDFDRELTDRGLRQCEDLGNHLLENPITCELILVSSARRTRMTYDALNHVLTSAQTLFLEELYLASANEILQTISTCATINYSILLIGHNDGISDLVSYFLDDYQHVPTSGYLHFQFNVEDWEHIVRGSGILIDSFYSQVR